MIQLIAEVLTDWAENYDQQEEANLVADLFADRLADKYPNFDRQQFVDIATGKKKR